MGGGGQCLQKTNIEWGDYLKRGAWAVCRFKVAGGEAWQKREGDVFEGEELYPMHTML